jgi:hypothetical protein
MGMIGAIGLGIDNKYKFSPYGKLNIKLALSQEGIEHQRQQDLARQEQERQRREAEERRLQNIRKIIGDATVATMQHQFDFSNPYAFNSDVLYHITSDYLYIHQWFGSSFVGSFLPEEASWKMPYNSQFFVRSVPNLANVRGKISSIYMKYIGVEIFTRANGSTTTLAVFDILYHE